MSVLSQVIIYKRAFSEIFTYWPQAHLASRHGKVASVLFFFLSFFITPAP